MRTNLSVVTIVDDRKNRFTDVDNNVFVRPVPSTGPCRSPTLMPVLVSGKKKLSRDYVKLGSFSDNKTETCIKSSRFKSHKRSWGVKRGKKGLR